MKLKHLKDIEKTLAHDSVMRKRFITPGELKSNIQTANYTELNPSEAFTPHAHPDCEEIFFVIEGDGVATIDSKKIRIKKGDLIVVEPGEVHSILNNTKKKFCYFQIRILV